MHPFPTRVRTPTLAPPQLPSRPFPPEEPGGEPHAAAAYATAAGVAEVEKRQEAHELRLLQLPGLGSAAAQVGLCACVRAYLFVCMCVYLCGVVGPSHEPHAGTRGRRGL